MKDEEKRGNPSKMYFNGAICNIELIKLQGKLIVLRTVLVAL